MDIVTIFVLSIVAVATLALGLSFIKEGAGKLAAFFLSGLAAGFSLPLLTVLNNDPVLNIWVGLGVLIAAVAMVNILRNSLKNSNKEATK